MWCKSSVFQDEQRARSTCKQLIERLKVANTDVTVMSLIYGESWYVASVAEVEPNQVGQKIIDTYLARGSVATLPQNIQESLLQRRMSRTVHASRTPGSPQLSYESHEPTPIMTDFSTKVPTPDIGDHRAHMHTVIESLTRQGYPFSEIYKKYVEFNMHTTTHEPESAFRGRMARYCEGVDVSQKYLFTESARSMHQAVFEDDETWITPSFHLWIEQDIAQPFPALDLHCKAIFVAKLRADEELIDESWLITVIDDCALNRIAFIYDPDRNIYQPTLDYRCPYNTCERKPTYIKTCENCLAECSVWARWLHTTIRMLRHDFAVSSEPQPFKVRNISYQEKRKVPRHHGKGPDKEKLITVDVPYIIIRYDVSETPATTHQDTEQEGTESQATRANWLTLHRKEDIIYEKRFPAPIKRRYTEQHYRPLITRVLAGELQAPSGEEYQLVHQEDGSVTVIGSVHFEQGKYVAMLKPDKRKIPVVRKVTAHKYENELGEE